MSDVLSLIIVFAAGLAAGITIGTMLAARARLIGLLAKLDLVSAALAGTIPQIPVRKRPGRPPAAPAVAGEKPKRGRKPKAAPAEQAQTLGAQLATTQQQQTTLTGLEQAA